MKTTLFAIALFLSLSSFAQLKIGNQDVDSATLSKYLLYCYLHPDTLKLSRVGEASLRNVKAGESVPMHMYYIDSNEQRVNTDGLAEIRQSVYYPPHKDTIYNEYYGKELGWTGATEKEVKDLNATLKAKTIQSGIKEIREIPAQTESKHTGKFLVPHCPTESDFKKWNVSAH